MSQMHEQDYKIVITSSRVPHWLMTLYVTKERDSIFKHGLSSSVLPKQPLSAFDLPLNVAIKPLHEEKKQWLFSYVENWRMLKNKGLGKPDLFPQDKCTCARTVFKVRAHSQKKIDHGPPLSFKFNANHKIWSYFTH